MKRIVALVVSVAAVQALMGCNQVLPDPLAFTLVDSVPVVRTCVPLVISSQSVKVYASDEDRLGSVVWLTTGSIEVDKGAEFPMLQPLPGFHEVIAPDTFNADQAFAFELDVDSGNGGAWNTWVRFAPGDLQEGVWLDSYSAPVASPCSSGASGTTPPRTP